MLKANTDPTACVYLPLHTAREIYERASQATGISVDDLLSERREKRIVKARWLVMRAMRDRRASYHMIARRMLMNHATVINGLREFDGLIAANDEIAVSIFALRTRAAE